MTRWRRTEHDVARADEDNIEVIAPSDVVGPECSREDQEHVENSDRGYAHLSIGTSLEGSMDGRREDAPDCLLETEVGESSTEGRRAKAGGLVSSEVRRDMVVVVDGDEGARR